MHAYVKHSSLEDQIHVLLSSLKVFFEHCYLQKKSHGEFKTHC